MAMTTEYPKMATHLAFQHISTGSRRKEVVTNPEPCQAASRNDVVLLRSREHATSFLSVFQVGEILVSGVLIWRNKFDEQKEEACQSEGLVEVAHRNEIDGGIVV